MGRNAARLASAMKIYGPGRLRRVERLCGGVQALDHSPAPASLAPSQAPFFHAPPLLLSGKDVRRQRFLVIAFAPFASQESSHCWQKGQVARGSYTLIILFVPKSLSSSAQPLSLLVRP